MRPSRCRSSGPLGRVGHRVLSALAVLATTGAHRLAAQAAQNSGALFLEFPVGARAVGMGQAAVADGGRGEAAFWNPAGLAWLPTGTFELHTATLAAGRTHAVTAYFPSSRIGVFGGAVYLADYGDFPRTDSANVVIGRIAPRNFEFLASYATRLSGFLAVGLNYKLITFQVDCSGDCRGFPNGEGVTHALDVGGQFTVGPNDAVRVGFALHNVGFRLQVENADQADPLPASLVVGARWQTPLGPVEEGRERFDLRLAADFDNPWGEAGRTEVRVGVDLGYLEFARLRAGYAARGGLAGPSVGIGVTSGSVGVDLAQTFMSGSDLEVGNPTFFAFHLTF